MCALVVDDNDAFGALVSALLAISRLLSSRRPTGRPRFTLHAILVQT
jgi:hypothetical protein